mmetsp:Transcript_71213/g.82834  ORF Transcript_71213/g.82834 Transcript_71213/m.82834 type:complete len:423 (-) Transcript_71213:159-1427(-)|eukprot:CAMPEP_0176440644 /NCGR_PEP_ID=MMETSP0127-20121128/20699_1 /TAXON_ID=938130 /ORGANISM="Platyophrya macrostoma, Strain WH" /LENGTH=422 /DNA_ID=CAMNT_0017825219 /DNA_START=30 /DNA_END=1298 /DNA_ORIENTATION=-
MIAKRILDFLAHRVNLVQAAAYSGSVPTQLQLSTTFEEEYRKNNEENERERDRNENTNNKKFNWILPSALVWMSYVSQDRKDYNVECFFGSKAEKLERNKLKNRFGVVQYAANKPIEDRFHTKQLESLDGYVVSVFDGHGGWQVAELAMNHLANDLDALLKENQKKHNNIDDCIKESLKQAFNKVEERYLEVAREAYENGFPAVARMGACGLVALVHNKRLYVANAGDCKAVLASTNEKGEVELTKLNQKFNANSKKEQQRLKSQFKENDIYICRKTGACYVKNILQPTRAFGDLELKYPEFNNPNNYGLDRGYQIPIENFKGPYITHEPDIKTFDIKPQDKYVILSSDGMWDELKKNDVSKIVKANISDKGNMAVSLLKGTLSAIEKRTNMSESELARIPQGQRRRVHDDITILVVNVQDQ